jgi:hypothetical protein
MMNNRKLLIGLALLALAAIAAGVAWDRHQTRKLQETTLARIDSATRALREAAIATQADSSAAASSTERIDQELIALRSTATGRISKLAAGADGYLLTAREVLRRQTVMLQLRTKIGAGITAFRAHMGDRSAADWTGKAVQLKNGLEQDYREFQRTLDAHIQIVESLPEACKALDTLVSGDRLVSAAEIKSLRENARSAAAALAGEISAARQLAAPR